MRPKGNLSKFALVGCLERLNEFVADFQERYDAKLRIGHSMRSPLEKETRNQRITVDPTKGRRDLRA